MQEVPAWSHDEIDRALAQWRLGDCVLQGIDFLWRIDPDRPLTEQARASAEGGYDTAVGEFPGAAVLTQTCDIVRTCLERPMIELAPLVHVEAPHIGRIRKGHQPRYLYIPTLADQCLVGDLDRRMTVEKSVVSHWTRTPGWNLDAEGRNLTRAIVRKTGRFAFPDDIVGMLRKLEQRIKARHGKDSDEGRLLEELEEIRLIATPNWDSNPLDLEFIVVLPEAISEQEPLLLKQVDHWHGMIEPLTRVARIEFSLEKLSTMTAQRYLDSDAMDFDHLSST